LPRTLVPSILGQQETESGAATVAAVSGLRPEERELYAAMRAAGARAGQRVHIFGEDLDDPGAGVESGTLWLPEADEPNDG
jgi:hypothetical protein